METINWPAAIERNREALLRIVAALVAMAGLGEGAIPTVPRYLRNRIYRILRPAESAVRRLIVIAARDLKATLRLASPLWGGRRVAREAGQSRVGVGTSMSVENPLHPAASSSLSLSRLGSPSRQGGGKVPAGGLVQTFPLIDPLKRFDFTPRRRTAKSFPRISIIGVTEPRPVPVIRIPSPGDAVDATRLRRRLAALQGALADLDAQARRLARWKARRDAKRLRAPRFSPMRPGWPPGFRKRRAHEIDGILRDLHALARTAWEAPDTS